ncbi:protein kinase [Clostridium culturomicium]|uniref:protein kinase n=1 Tax=Clostridium culturomicium TaxID=1499683 RepID=UPI00058B5937|nr:protein kinase [Clostridium culturomicium]
MSRHFTNKIYLSEDIENLIKASKFLGKGNNGVVYRIDEQKIIKVFNEEKVCRTELSILKASSKCAAFPQVYGYGDFYIIRDFVEGIRLDKYLNKNPINREIVQSIVDLIMDFKKLHYKKLDIRCKDLYVQEDFTLRVIDPKNNYSKTVNYPRHLMKGIFKRNQIGFFFFYLQQIDKELYEKWRIQFQQYANSLSELP